MFGRGLIVKTCEMGARHSTPCCISSSSVSGGFAHEPLFLSIHSDSVTNIEQASAVFLSLLSFAQNQIPFDPPMIAKAIRFLNFLVSDRKPEFTPDQLLHSLVPVPNKSCSGLADSVMDLHSIVDSNFQECLLSFVLNILHHATYSQRMEVVETGLVKRLFLRFQDHFGPISGSIADSLTRILRYSIILCKPMFMAIIKPKTDRKTKKYLDTIYTKAIGPSRQFIDFICKFYRTLADSPDSRYFGWTLGALLEIAPLSFDATLFVRSLPVALTIISSLDHFETDFLIMWSLDHVRDGMVEWDHQKDIIMGRGKLMLFDLKSEGIADITIQRSHTTSQTVYGTTMLRECRSVTSLLGGNV